MPMNIEPVVRPEIVFRGSKYVLVHATLKRLKYRRKDLV